MKEKDALNMPCPMMSQPMVMSTDPANEDGVHHRVASHFIYCNGSHCPVWRSHEYIHWLKSERSPEGYKKPSNEMLLNHHKTYDKKTNYNWFYCVIRKDEGECGLITIGCESE